MTILMYFIGVFVASILTIIMVNTLMKRVNRAEFVMLLIFSLFSWVLVLVQVLVLAIEGVDWTKEIWRKKE